MELNLRNTVWEGGLNLTGSGWGPLKGCCEPSSSVSWPAEWLSASELWT